MLTRKEKIMTEEEILELIKKNSDKSLNEIKRIIKSKMPLEQRSQFTFEDLLRFIAKFNEKEQNIENCYFNKNQLSKEVKGEER